MPGIVIPNEGQIELANDLLTTAINTAKRYLVDLFQNQYLPNQTTTMANFTLSNFPGYQQVNISRASWLPAVINSNNQAVVSWSQNPASWNNNGASQPCWGYLVSSSITGKVLWCQAFDTVQIIGLGKSLELDIALNVFGSNP